MKKILTITALASGSAIGTASVLSAPATPSNQCAPAVEDAAPLRAEVTPTVDRLAGTTKDRFQKNRSERSLELWTRRGSWFWMLSDWSNGRGVVGSAPSAHQAARDACATLEETRSESDHDSLTKGNCPSAEGR
jgi:hypothetical protein